MSMTLFRYLFREQVKIFFLASGALSGIMSFGGLLRPLAEHGLDLGQVVKMLGYLSPAMSTYSVPVAALFATTMVYGRLAADNELTACRASGMSYFAIAFPAVVMGLLVAIGSLLFLCFIVPVFTLRVEQVIYSNIAKVIASKIERNHQVGFGSGDGLVWVFAQEAHLKPLDPNRPNEQEVELVGPAISTFSTLGPGLDPLKVPRDFYMANRAVIAINPGPGGIGTDAQLSAKLYGGIRFPRNFEGAMQAGVADTQFGPIDIPSMISENVKFMSIGRLWALTNDPGLSQRVQNSLKLLVRADQRQMFLADLARQINRSPNSGGGSVTLWANDPAEESFTLQTGGGTAYFRGADLILTGPGSIEARGVHFTQGPIPRASTAPATQPAAVSGLLTAEAREARLTAVPDQADGRMSVAIELYDAMVHVGEEPTPHLSFIRSFSVPMPEAVSRLADAGPGTYLLDRTNRTNSLRRECIVVSNNVRSERHSRASFSISCLILVIVGCILGMMFRSGNFLSAFAVSFMPAMLCVTLIVSGQQAANHVPWDVTHPFRNPLNLGLWVIWTGNILVAILAVALAMRLRRR